VRQEWAEVGEAVADEQVGEEEDEGDEDEDEEEDLGEGS